MSDLTPRQVYWFKRVADGNGASASNNVTLRSLVRHGLVYVTWREAPDAITGKFAFWLLTEKGAALIAEAKEQAGAL